MKNMVKHQNPRNGGKRTKSKFKSSKGFDKNPSLPRTYHWQVLGSLVDDLGGYLTVEEVNELRYLIRIRDLHRLLSYCEAWDLRGINLSSVTRSFDRLKAQYTIACLLKKYLPAPDPSLDRVALATVRKAEDQCKHFNDTGYLSLCAGGEFSESILTDARRFLGKVLGTAPPIRRICEEGRHGPGANLDTSKGRVSSYDKYSNIPYSCTRRAAGYARYMIESDERWFNALELTFKQEHDLDRDSKVDLLEFWTWAVRLVDHNRIGFVPKNAKTSRSIAIEPALNLMLQLGTDAFIRRRLKRWGIDLDDQLPNQRLSRAGSKWGSYATIDLSAASDTISMRICEMLLPREWYTFLLDLRSERGLLEDGSYIQYNKISSMGNGYTFALESAIFAAIVYAAIKLDGKEPCFGRNCVVFGDDIIVPNETYYTCVSALELSGFTVNTDKSFNYGPVRESCGTDWFLGMPVRPVFLENPPENLPGILTDRNRLIRMLQIRFGLTETNVERLYRKWIPPKAFRGPISDEVFDSWVHTPEPGVWKNGEYHFRRLLQKSMKLRVGPRLDFRFVKLMHNLRERPAPRFYEKQKLSANGSRFTIHLRKMVVMQKPAVSTYWRTVYEEVLPDITN